MRCSLQAGADRYKTDAKRSTGFDLAKRAGYSSIRRVFEPLASDLDMVDQAST